MNLTFLAFHKKKLLSWLQRARVSPSVALPAETIYDVIAKQYLFDHYIEKANQDQGFTLSRDLHLIKTKGRGKRNFGGKEESFRVENSLLKQTGFLITRHKTQ